MSPTMAGKSHEINNLGFAFPWIFAGREIYNLPMYSNAP